LEDDKFITVVDDYKLQIIQYSNEIREINDVSNEKIRTVFTLVYAHKITLLRVVESKKLLVGTEMGYFDIILCDKNKF